jgi:hypothetical protein
MDVDDKPRDGSVGDGGGVGGGDDAMDVDKGVAVPSPRPTPTMVRMGLRKKWTRILNRVVQKDLTYKMEYKWQDTGVWYRCSILKYKRNSVYVMYHNKVDDDREKVENGNNQTVSELARHLAEWEFHGWVRHGWPKRGISDGWDAQGKAPLSKKRPAAGDLPRRRKRELDILTLDMSGLRF